ncbi:MAG: cytochrome c biogenesis protein CcsA [Fimbriimonadaceae bacterium]
METLNSTKLSPGALAVRAVFGLAMAFTIVWSFEVPELPTFQQPELARIFFWHFPCPMVASVLLIVGAYQSLRFVRRGDLKWDVKAAAALELGMIFCLLTMATGMLFSKVQWGAWWQNDPRQTSFLLVLMIYFAYFVLRGAFADRMRRATYAAGYALAATLPVLFLIFVFPRLPQVESFHPSNSIWSGQIRGSYAEVVIATTTLTSLLSIWLFRIRVRAGELELETYESIGLEIGGGDSAAPRVVRPVRVPAAGGVQASEGASAHDGAG